MSENTASIKAAIAPASASLTATLIPASKAAEETVAPEVATPAPATPPSEKMLGITVGQFTTLVAEISVIEKRAARLAVLTADNAAALHVQVDEAVRAGNVQKKFLEDLRDKLAVSQEASLIAILVSNLATRFNPSAADLSRGDLSPRA
jgi:hypothetical protein